MDLAAQDTNYRASAGISWVVQETGVQVIDEVARRSETLAYPAAAAWELILRGHTPHRAASLLGCILGVEAEAAQTQIERLLRDWVACGWIVAMAFTREACADHG